MEKLTGKELDEQIQNKQAAMELASSAATKGDPICGAMFSLLHDAKSVPGGDFVTGTGWMFDDEDEDIRPY